MLFSDNIWLRELVAYFGASWKSHYIAVIEKVFLFDVPASKSV